MIKETAQIINAKGKSVYVTRNTGYRMIGETLMLGDENSVTISRKPIIEIPFEDLPEDQDMDRAKETLRQKILKGDFAESDVQKVERLYTKSKLETRKSKQ
jgi:hypothetical protein